MPQIRAQGFMFLESQLTRLHRQLVHPRFNEPTFLPAVIEQRTLLKASSRSPKGTRDFPSASSFPFTFDTFYLGKMPQRQGHKSPRESEWGVNGVGALYGAGVELDWHCRSALRKGSYAPQLYHLPESQGSS